MSGHDFLDRKLEEDRIGPVDEDEWRARQDEYERETSGVGIEEGARAVDAYLHSRRHEWCEVCHRPTSAWASRCRNHEED